MSVFKRMNFIPDHPKWYYCGCHLRNALMILASSEIVVSLIILSCTITFFAISDTEKHKEIFTWNKSARNNNNSNRTETKTRKLSPKMQTIVGILQELESNACEFILSSTAWNIPHSKA
ncbi:hypothetical protein X798_06411 [Onchocerca flexuosa]|uniref:Uncharacterized protein n=1 Tax=Onchocerca flexuosa TaxID=387005 RepID=A0A238BMG9_9BILA|nr:hypothetical protein X798_06411 [Onchocerca flexuosa]